ncbi:MAG: DNA replication/repair protein RecF [Proteobacteria bacterium]|nr:DNA replication/repair protein RecF [Pseudomonadota bacterium]
MELSQLQINNVRNLQQVKLQGLQKVNVFYGPNGAGKTSILEAIHLLGMARSFRGSSVKPLITHGCDDCTVFGSISASSPGGPTSRLALGVQRSASGEVQIKVAGKAVRTAAQLVEHLPLQTINADSFDLLTGAPQARRRYLDWGVFHVEHRFYSQWQRFQRCIKQRNNLLRHGKMSDTELAVWTRDLAVSGTAIGEYRQAYFAELKPQFLDIIETLAPELKGLDLRYRQGWEKNTPYEDALAISLGVDRERGYTHVGPQRADIKVTIDARPAAEVLSRGQQKLVVCAMKLAQGQLMSARGKGRCTYLVDDLRSELDEHHSKLVCGLLSTMQVQVFVTSIARDDVCSVWPKSDGLEVFHVEHGQVKPEGNCPSP